ncbi:Ribosomal protein L10/L12 [Carpediemonas membranifera]|uniref:Ribosomal protein L10/L12 n=1 Tax=Carpediemonas membranifera TaxID=201153 RepID=A0A8J6DXF3_9EUKA|nr:Ribosomal protein L10/L12 [Carpediemonas membranifera]|eukprot:KAG9390039.1 Ribosomal protein L10/L12 [Carpediemonas membranifera]
MKNLAAYMLCVLGGNTAPSAQDMTSVLSSVGVDADSAQCDLIMSELAGKNLEEVIAAGAEKLATVPTGGAAPAAAGAAAATEEAAEEPAEESESDSDMGFDLFG